MDERDWLAERFEENRTHLKAVAYRMLGSLNEADDAVQEAWIRLGRSDADEIQDLRAWLTTVVARVSLNMLRSRKRRREESMDLRMPDPIIDPADGTDPEHEALLADSVGLALLVVLETLTPAERLSFVLHDMFGIRFEEIGQIIDRSPQASRQLANRARHKVRDARTEPDPDLHAQREVVDAFLAAAREGDFERLVAVLDPDVVLAGRFRGRRTIAGNPWGRGCRFQRGHVPAARAGGAAGAHQRRRGAVSLRDGKPFSIGAVTVRDGKIVELDFLADPERLAQLDLTILDG